MWKEGDLQDDKICINIEDKQFLCNRTTLCLHSSYFVAMFNGSFIEKDQKNITLQDVNVKGFSNILKYIEQNVTNANFEDIIDIIECANMLQFQDVHKIFSEQLMPELNVDNCLQMWEDCETLDIHPLLERAKYKAYKEFHQVIKTDYFQKLEPKKLHSYLSNTFIHCNDEMEIFGAGMKWWCGYSKNLKKNKTLPDEEITKYLLLVLSCIDFKTINPNDVEIMLNHRKIRKNKKIISILNEIQNLLTVLQNKNNSANVTTYEELDCNIEVCEETKRLFSNSRREKKLLICIVTSELGETNARNSRIMNLSYYDEKSKSLKKVFKNNSNFQKNCVYPLKCFRLIPYNENLLFIGGFLYRKIFVDRDIWIYYTEKDEWTYFSKAPTPKTRYILSTLFDNDGFFIGQNTLGRPYTLTLHNLIYYDLNTRNWKHQKTPPPPKLCKSRFCKYKNEILLLSEDYSEAYLFNKNDSSNSYKKLQIVRRTSDSDNEIYGNIILFCIEDIIYLKSGNDSNLYEFEIQDNILIEKNVTKLHNYTIKLTMDFELNEYLIMNYKLNYILDKHNLYIFTKVELTTCGIRNYCSIPDDISYVYDLELHCLNMNTKINEKIIEIKNEYDQEWHMNRGCFQFSHYKAIEFNSCISKFIL